MKILDIEHRIKSNEIFCHPFLLKLKEGNYNSNQIKLWISQQFYFSNQFPRCLGLLWSRIPDYQISLPLMKFLAVEHWGSEETGAHWKHYRQVLYYFNLTINELKAIEPFPETKEYLDYRFDICLNKPLEQGLGCMGFAHELVNEKIFTYYYKGVKSIKNIPETALKYFKSHIEDEPEDYKVFKAIIEAYVQSEEKMKLVERGAIETLAKRTIFFDKIKDRLDSLV